MSEHMYKASAMDTALTQCMHHHLPKTAHYDDYVGSDLM
jgi:hypothetical protein